MTILENRWFGVAALCACAAAGIVVSVPFRSVFQPIAVGITVALGMVLAGFWSLSWALSRSNKVFFSVFVAGTLSRLTGLAVTVVVVLRCTKLAIVPVLLSMVIGLIALSFVEMFFIQRQARLTRYEFH